MLSVCPHDCPSSCSLVVTVPDGRLTEVTGNSEHPYRVTDMGGGPALHSNLVEVAPL